MHRSEFTTGRGGVKRLTQRVGKKVQDQISRIEAPVWFLYGNTICMVIGSDSYKVQDRKTRKSPHCPQFPIHVIITLPLPYIGITLQKRDCGDFLIF